MGSRLRMTSTVLESTRLPTVSEIFATRAFRSSALERIALSTAGQYFSWSGVSCNAAFTRSIRKSISVFRSAAFNRSGVTGEGVCAWAIGDAVRKSAVAPTATIFIIGDLLGKLPPRHPAKQKWLRTAARVDSNQRNQRSFFCAAFAPLMSGTGVPGDSGYESAARTLRRPLFAADLLPDPARHRVG
jgi:hypothetical protein